jgi:hypothetical protein
MQSGDKKEREKAESIYRGLRAKAKQGKSAAQDACYAIERLNYEQNRQAQFVLGGSNPYIPNSLVVGFDYENVVKNVKKRIKKGDANAIRAAGIFRGMISKNSKKRVKTSLAYARLAKLAKKGNTPARSTLRYYRQLVAASREQRRRVQDPAAVMGGFNFKKFMRDVGKVAGPLMQKLAPIAKSIPFYGALLEPALKLTGEAISGKPQAKRKIRRVRRLAKAGVPRAIRADAALKAAKKIRQVKALKDGIATGAIRIRSKSETKAQKFARRLTTKKKASIYEAGVRRGVRAGLRRGRIKIV